MNNYSRVFWVQVLGNQNLTYSSLLDDGYMFMWASVVCFFYTTTKAITYVFSYSCPFQLCYCLFCLDIEKIIASRIIVKCDYSKDKNIGYVHHNTNVYET